MRVSKSSQLLRIFRLIPMNNFWMKRFIQDNGPEEAEAGFEGKLAVEFFEAKLQSIVIELLGAARLAALQF